jgi:hypothetical protein
MLVRDRDFVKSITGICPSHQTAITGSPCVGIYIGFFIFQRMAIFMELPTCVAE